MFTILIKAIKHFPIHRILSNQNYCSNREYLHDCDLLYFIKGVEGHYHKLDDWSKNGQGEAREFPACETVPYNLSCDVKLLKSLFYSFQSRR